MGKRKTPDERVAALEAKRLKGQREPPCVVGLPGEAPADTVQRIHSAGRRSAALVAPFVPSVEEWSRQAEGYQRWLLNRTAGINEPGFVEPTADEIDAAYRRAMTV